jgi:hypothetical protein
MILTGIGEQRLMPLRLLGKSDEVVGDRRTLIIAAVQLSPGDHCTPLGITCITLVVPLELCSPIRWFLLRAIMVGQFEHRLIIAFSGQMNLFWRI